MQSEFDIIRYNTLRNKLNSIVSNLSLTISNNLNIIDEIKGKYQLNDDYTPVVSRMTQLNKNIESTYNYLNNNVIPAIDSAINCLNNEI